MISRQSSVADIVVKRRRLRPRDTTTECTGEMTAHTSDSLVAEASVHPTSARFIDLASKVHKSRTVRDKQVTVEDFLRWSTRKTVKDGKRKQTRHIQFSDSPDHSDAACEHDSEFEDALKPPKRKRATRRITDSDDEYEPSSQEASKAKPNSRKKLRTQTGSLTQRMLRAAAMAHVDIDKDALGAHVLAERNPLKFAATQSALSQPGKQAGKWRLVDPRKVSATRPQPTFHTPRPPPEAGNRLRQMSKWAPSIAACPVPVEKPKFVPRQRTHVEVKEKPPSTPLSFVGIDVHNRSAHPFKHSSSRTQSGPVAGPSSPRKALAFHVTPPPEPSALDPSHNFGNSNSTRRRAIPTLHPTNPQPTASHPTRPRDNTRLTHSSNTLSPQNSRQNTPSIQLRPLASYLDGFRQNARAIALQEARSHQ